MVRNQCLKFIRLTNQNQGFPKYFEITNTNATNFCHFIEYDPCNNIIYVRTHRRNNNADIMEFEACILKYITNPNPNNLRISILKSTQIWKTTNFFLCLVPLVLAHGKCTISCYKIHHLKILMSCRFPD